MAERNDVITFKGGPLTLLGASSPAAGQKAPDFKVSKSLLEDVQLSSLAGKKVVLNVVPSLDTPVCHTQTARFNAEAAKLGSDVVILTISVDLPVAQARWCQANAATAIMTASDYKHHEFSQAFNLTIKELGLLARAVYVIDREGVIRYAEVVKEVSSEPNYADALNALTAIK